MKIILIFLLCGVLLLSGCSFEDSDGAPSSDLNSSQPKITLNTPEPSSDDPVSQPQTQDISSPPVPPVYQDIEAAVYENTLQEFSKLYEFESGIFGEEAEITDARENSSGGAAVRAVSSAVSVVLDITASQHYNITLRAAAFEPMSGSFQVNGTPRGSFSMSGGEEYEAVMFKNIYLPKGSILTFTGFTGAVDLDCVMVENSSEPMSAEYSDIDGPVTPNASENTVKLYDYLKKTYGKSVISGQQVSQGSNRELEEAYELTGRYPAIRFGDMMDYSVGNDTGDIELAIEWAKSGGIVGYSWFWPIGGTCYAQDGASEAFDIDKAVTSLDLAAVEPDALTIKLDSGEISLETATVIAGIDLCAIQLKRLADEGIPVLFRPLPEASGGEFWWSKSKESYLWLYKLIFERFYIRHGLDNIIWVWNAQDPDWYPGDSTVDIIALDVYYPDGAADASPSGINSLIAARGISCKKPVALSEVSPIPSPDAISRDNAFFLFASSWTGDYSPTGSKTPPEVWRTFYNSSIVVTKDEIEYNR